MPRAKPTPPVAMTAPDVKAVIREIQAEDTRLPQLIAMHRQGLAVQAPAFKASLQTMSELCGSWFTSVQGFNRDNFDGDCMLIVTEIAEAVEADRKKAADDHVPSIEGRAVELADALVRILHVASKYNIPLGEAFIAKMEYNFTRPVLHGKGY